MFALTEQLKEQRLERGRGCSSSGSAAGEASLVAVEGLHPSLGLEELSWREKILLRPVGGCVGPSREHWEKAKTAKSRAERDTTENRDGSGAVNPAATSGSHPACCTLSSLLRLAEHPWVPPLAQFPPEIPKCLVLWQQSARCSAGVRGLPTPNKSLISSLFPTKCFYFCFDKAG